MKISIFRRVKTVYIILGKNLVFGFLPYSLVFYFISSYSSKYIYDFRLCFFPSLIYKKVKNPIIIVGNPRSGTTFLHRFLIKNHIGSGSQLFN